MLVFKSPFGNGGDIVIREGTLILAVFTGLLMRLTDPLVKFIFSSAIDRYDKKEDAAL